MLGISTILFLPEDKKTVRTRKKFKEKYLILNVEKNKDYDIHK